MSAATSIPSVPRILVVDDDSMVRFNIAAYLEDNGYKVSEAGTGPDAIVALRDQSPDLVL
jgi:CheY-like chemotaxis protein